ncbi:MAG: PhnD/SsuA/transferrin family substrate-binding protein, partial [Sandaracinaceae bacterium]|nr:PhnD/SsuA/transferrin family substrate-binding protein [Sandaracinaceae bacterium]
WMLRCAGVEPEEELSIQMSFSSPQEVIEAFEAQEIDIGAVQGIRRVDGTIWHLGIDHDFLHVLGASDPLPGDVFATSTKVPEPLARAVAKRLLRLEPDELASRSLLAAVGAERLGEFRAEDYLLVAKALEAEDLALRRDKRAR